MKTEVENILISKKINPTANRMLVLDYLLDQHAAISLTDIEKGLTPANRVTIYRSLKLFSEQGLVHAVEDGTGTPKYALCIEDCNAEGHHDLHLHFYCSNCKETYCLPSTLIPKVELPDKFRVEEVNLLIKGICDKCV
ncbi:MAG: transcriptional repressor [Sphingobacteriales bacterium 17-39-43]|jgi:Fur family ferric uptake transcriptional regulator|uniref:Fur family transcriptional regulator n=1 Tax=Daejeonella sp. TaxID=2805397 RepID=UPI000BCC1C54|nr:transcriptional repressor [Daejeonella sp.]OYZ31667.1 MAG: transcriptional repressor [Sphingobacteriales bacterium 16-39-50]OYZ44893.1 MAG: transcriptional repressor [Sphingobacteriales bacterium 24-40-4]OZA25062.1 MAG: transcriptional repressor [Sphingobacteriales bacterium 17-39-43]HQS05234.1 transcriptional repressor [Daejeonella sp.]HQT23648.1 transcriptional repressor [Daejeonella sp.]